MIVSLHRWIIELIDDEDSVYPPIIPEGHYESDRIRLDRIDKYSISDDKTEIILTIGGNEFFYDYCEKGHEIIRRYFDMLDTEFN